MKYQPAGNRILDCPLKILLQCYIETGTGHKALVLENVMMMMMMMMMMHSFVITVVGLCVGEMRNSKRI